MEPEESSQLLLPVAPSPTHWTLKMNCVCVCTLQWQKKLLSFLQHLYHHRPEESSLQCATQNVPILVAEVVNVVWVWATAKWERELKSHHSLHYCTSIHLTVKKKMKACMVD